MQKHIKLINIFFVDLRISNMLYGGLCESIFLYFWSVLESFQKYIDRLLLVHRMWMLILDMLLLVREEEMLILDILLPVHRKWMLILVELTVYMIKELGPHGK